MRIDVVDLLCSTVMTAKGTSWNPLITTDCVAMSSVKVLPSLVIVMGPFGSAASVELSSSGVGAAFGSAALAFFAAGLDMMPITRAATPPNPEHVTVSSAVWAMPPNVALSMNGVTSSARRLRR